MEGLILSSSSNNFLQIDVLPAPDGEDMTISMFVVSIFSINLIF